MTLAREFWIAVEDLRPVIQSPFAWCCGWFIYVVILGMESQARDSVLRARSMVGAPEDGAAVRAAQSDFHLWFRITYGVCLGIEISILALWCSSSYFDWAGRSGAFRAIPPSLPTSGRRRS